LILCVQTFSRYVFPLFALRNYQLICLKKNPTYSKENFTVVRKTLRKEAETSVSLLEEGGGG
jgi:hypothetical protein